MKKILLVILILLSASITACSAKDKPTEKSTELQEKTTTKSDAESEKKQPEKQGQSALSDDLYSYQIQIDDITYEFPMSYSEFAEKGWSFESDASEVLESSQYLSGQVWSKDMLKCYTYIANNEEDSKPISECQITGIVLEGNNLKNASSTFTLPGNIQYMTSSKEDIIAAFGKPTRETSSGSILTYSEKNYCEVRFEFDSDNKLNTISLQNMSQ